MKTGVELIAAERERQITAEGWTASHDDGHTKAELTVASNQYASFAAVQVRSEGKALPPEWFVPINWPWPRGWWKPSEDPIRNLVKAGALIAAEIDRLLREELNDRLIREDGSDDDFIKAHGEIMEEMLAEMERPDSKNTGSSEAEKNSCRRCHGMGWVPSNTDADTDPCPDCDGGFARR